MRLLSLLLVVSVLAGCNPGNKDQDDGAVRGSGGQAKTSSKGVARKALYPEEDALSILRELNAGEIVTSRYARDVSQNDDVLRFAAVIARDHSELMLLVDSLGLQARDNLISGSLKRATDSTVAAWQGMPAGFNNTFMDYQVRAHQKALMLLDTAITPSARNPKLRDLLLAVRPTLEAHLQRAMQIYAMRKKQAAERGEEFVVNPAPTVRVDRPAVTPSSEPAPAPTPVKPDSVPLTTTQH